jgi:hypothetical protein
MNPNIIKIDDVEYVKKDHNNPEIIKDYVIVRTRSAGVFAGELQSKNEQEVVLKNARRLWQWYGAASLSQLAMEGVSKPNDCKFPCEVTSITLTQAIEIIPCTDKALKSIKGVPIWKA